MSLIRTFVALDVSPESQSRAVKLIDRLKTSGAQVSWTARENLHLTLKFLGDVPDTRIPEVCQAVIRAAADFAPYLIHFQGAGAFPNADRPRTVWLGTDTGSETTVLLQRAIENGLYKIGFPPEQRRFVPHLTLGRVRSGGPSQEALGSILQAAVDYDGGSTEVDEVVIYASILERTGATYEVLGRAPLEG